MCFATKWFLGLACGAILCLSGCGGVSHGGPGNTSTQQAQLSVSATGAGTVTSNPAGINCGSTCTATFNSGTTVTLMATPGTGNSFAGWSGACSGASTTCSLVLNSASSVAAVFGKPAQLTVSETGSGSGIVTSNPAGINCGQTCTAAFATGTTVTLTAAPNSGFVFSRWSGACSGTGTCTVALNGNTSVTATFGGGTLQSVNHIIFMAQENRGFLHYFGALPKYWADNGYTAEQFDGLPQFNTPAGPAPTNPGCDPAFPPPSGCHFDPSVQVQSFHMADKCVENPTPFWDQSHPDFNFNDPVSGTATLDGFVNTAASLARSTNFTDVNGIRAMGYYTGDDLNYYYFMASNFGTSDRWFSPVMTRSEPNRMYMLSATSVGHIRQLAQGSPLLTNKTIFEALQDAGISWKVYISDPVAGPNLIPGSAMSMFSFAYKFPQNFVPASEFMTDAANGTLPQVAMIEPGYSTGTDEHPFEDSTRPGGSVEAGAKYVSGFINVLMQSQSWRDSVFMLTWDEFGGFYDDVAPKPTVSPDGIPPVDLLNALCSGATGPTCDFVYTGYRLPLIVVSPFTRKHYVSHTVADYTAILKFIETRFNLASLTARDAAQMDMTEFFDFANAPWSTPPSPPVQFKNGPCQDTLP
jgi:phospholipase C